MKKLIFIFLLLFSASASAQIWWNDSLIVGYIDTTHILHFHFTGSSSGTNTGDVTLAGQNYLSISGQVITANAVNLSGSNITSTLAETHGGTNQTTWTLGDIPYASASNTLSKLAGNITSAKQYLSQTGTGSVSAVPSWSAMLAKTVVDLSDGHGSTIRDSDMSGAPITIVPTSKPATPQWIMGIRTQDIPTTGSGTYVQSWEVWISAGVHNNNGSTSETINWRFTLNGTDWSGTADASLACPTATPFGKFIGVLRNGTNPINVGDTIGIKLWGGAASQLDLRYVSLYIVPNKYSRISNGFETIPPLNSTAYFRAALNGAIAGVTYVAASPAYTYSFGDNNLAVVAEFGFTSGVPLTISDPLYLGVWNSGTPVNVNNSFSAVTAAANLYGLQGASPTSLLRYIYVYK